MKEITTCEEFIDAFVDTAESEFILMNDLNFADFGQIFSAVTKNNSAVQKIDLGGHEITNLYPVFTDVFILASGSAVISNGKITNILCADGHFVDARTSISPSSNKYSDVFALSSSNFKLKFEKIGFSILGCNYDYQTNSNNTGIINAANLNASYPHTTIVFDRCSFYIHTINSIPLLNHSVFKNCSFMFDECEYSSLEYKVSSYQTSGVVSHSVFFFCVIKGKIVKSDEFSRDDIYARKTMGELINCYVDLETDIENLFINVSLTAYPNNLNNFLKTLDESSLQSTYIGTDTVYNNEKWLGDSDKNFIVGGQSLTSEQLHDSDYLMRCGFLAIDESED